MNRETYERLLNVKPSYDDKGEKMKHNHEELLQKLQKDMPIDNILLDLSDLFKLFGDSTRLKILYALFESEMCVCAIAELLHMTQSAISHQLKTLKDGSLISNRREGKTIYYFLADEHVKTIIGQGYEHIKEKTEK